MTRSPHRRLWMQLLVVIVSAIVIRGVVVWLRFDSLQADPDAYRVIAESLAKTGTYGLMGESGEATPTAFRPPLYPWLLSWLVTPEGMLSLGAVACLHVLLGTLTTAMTWDIARRWWSGRVAWFAAGLVAVDPMLLWQSTLIMTETLATALAVMVWWWWVARLNPKPIDQCFDDGTPANACDVSAGRPMMDAVVFGCLLSATILCRPTFLVWAVMLLPAMLLVGPTCVIRRTVRVGVAALIVVAAVGMWTLRNWNELGHPVWATTHGGYTLLLANNDSFYDYLETDSNVMPWNRKPWDPSEFFATYEARQRGDDEVSDDRVAYEMAKETIAGRPALFVWSSLVRAARLWHPFPARTSDRSAKVVYTVGFYQTAMLLLALIGVGKHWRKWLQANAWPAIALVIALTGVHSVYWSNARMRSPAIPLLAIAAACVAAQATSNCRRLRSY
ncbi:ArnT family glycosyltransferase [Rhodopirellula halodulae]|uniref:ArnT family glycosyltransferase n=1 Tax=Rhodopirellula halodulae TaxID=2894198 RepID=UPI001E440A62|nr:hypothetical protein [Rhodopirellula sp. JC737]MCC9654701.1 hypothetical protein [Rhodopirellula sp. JC737]